MMMVMVMMILLGGLGPADYNLTEVKRWLAGKYGMRGDDIQVNFSPQTNEYIFEVIIIIICLRLTLMCHFTYVFYLSFIL